MVQRLLHGLQRSPRRGRAGLAHFHMDDLMPLGLAGRSGLPVEVEVTDEPTTDTAQDGLVVRQSPSAATARPKGGVVTIVVARLG